jgi:hypothetical protein
MASHLPTATAICGMTPSVRSLGRRPCSAVMPWRSHLATLRFTTFRHRPFWMTMGVFMVTGTRRSSKVPSTSVWVMVTGLPPTGLEQTSHATWGGNSSGAPPVGT